MKNRVRQTGRIPIGHNPVAGGHALPRNAQTPRAVVLERLGTRSGDAHTSCVAVQCPRQQAQEALEVPPVASTVAVIILKAT